MLSDQSHINKVREALWQLPVGKASLMIGAGFSRNAKPRGTDSREFPLWQHTTTALSEALYPASDSAQLKRALADATGTSGFLRLAQEYEVAFGRPALNAVIRNLVPDEEYVPDSIHKRMLRLPWRDVFTTNWDTLLERTRRSSAPKIYLAGWLNLAPHRRRMQWAKPTRLSKQWRTSGRWFSNR